jgi:tRNA threonylcarbamoyladenosine biosynthesis protein TsaE
MTLLPASAEEMEALGARLAALCRPGMRLYLQGELGAGKTTLARGILRGLGHRGSVKSPTYTLVEPYLIDNKRIYHFDLYRITDPEELEAIGLRDYLDSDSLCLVEWPERAAALLGEPDLLIAIAIEGTGRAVTLTPGSPAGRAVLAGLETENQD